MGILKKKYWFSLSELIFDFGLIAISQVNSKSRDFLNREKA